MFAVQFRSFGAPSVLAVADHPEPHAGPGEVRVRVRAAGVSPVDLALRDGTSPSAGTLALPHIPGIDAAGVVDEVGEGVEGVSPGDEVLGSVDVARLGGATAEFAVLAFWGRKPAELSWEGAGSTASSVETATRALDLLEPLDGATLVVEGAAGGVGSVAVQLAVARGARVLGAGSAASQGFITGLGATPLPAGELPGAPVDRVLHIRGARSLPELVALTGDPRWVVTITDFTGAAIGVRASVGELGGQPNGRHGLAVAAALAEAGRFRVPIRAAFPSERAAEAHLLAGASPRWGKVAITLP